MIQVPGTLKMKDVVGLPDYAMGAMDKDGVIKITWNS